MYQHFELVHTAQALPEGREAGLELYIVAVRGSGLQTIVRSFDKSNKGLPTSVSIDSEDEITGGSLVRFLFKGSLVLCSPESCCAWSSPGCLGGNQIY